MVAEVKFWTERRKNLEGIYNQLRDPRVKRMGEILELSESAYFPCFKTLFRNVVAGESRGEGHGFESRPCSQLFTLLIELAVQLFASRL